MLLRSDEDFIVFLIPTVISAEFPYNERNPPKHTGVAPFDEKRLGEMGGGEGNMDRRDADVCTSYVHTDTCTNLLVH